MSNFKEAIEGIKREIEAYGARPEEIDKFLSELRGLNEDSDFRDLLLLLDGEAEWDESMYSIVHFVEKQQIEKYIHQLLIVFPELTSKSPRWASILLVRILNSEPAKIEAIRQVKFSADSVKRAIWDMCDRINGVSPTFLSKTIALSLAAKTDAS